MIWCGDTRNEVQFFDETSYRLVMLVLVGQQYDVITIAIELTGAEPTFNDLVKETHEIMLR